MIILWTACVLLCVTFVAALTLWLRVKGDIRQMSKKLNEIMQTDTNAQLSTTTFDKDVSSLMDRANALLSKSRQVYIDARRAEEDLKRAITNISHDLRTPLTSAKGYLQMLDKPAGSPLTDTETANRYLTIIRGRLETLTTLMDSLFAFSSALDGNLSVQKINIGSILRDTLSDSFTELEQKGFTVESSIPDTPVYGYCDEAALSRVLQNLLKNAYIHGRDYLRVSLTGNIIEVANKADGLYDLDVLRIFDRFYTADAARTQKRTGLGLAIAKELTEKMGGRISAEIKDGMLAVYIVLIRYNNQNERGVSL